MKHYESDESKQVVEDNVNLSRRNALVKLGLLAVATYAAPLFLKLSDAHASSGGFGGGSGGGSGGSGGGSGSSGGSGSGSHGDSHGDSHGSSRGDSHGLSPYSESSGRGKGLFK